MTAARSEPPLTRRAILSQAWPLMIGQVSVPLVALVDTVVVGQTGDPVALAGVALGSVIISFLFWSFGFLRMGMTGLTAQALGREETDEVDALLIRGLAAGLVIGLVLFALQTLLTPLALWAMAGGEALDAEASGYIAARFFGAPASLAVFALTGWLFGLGETRRALVLQVVMNLANAALDVLFVWRFDMGAQGIGIGTAIAEWLALAVGLWLARPLLSEAILARLRSARRVFDPAAMKRLFAFNFDIMVRTVALLLLFAWFTRAGARIGTVQLAANLVLEQFVLVAAYVLDAFAFTAESRVGMAFGRGSRSQLLRATRLTGEFSLAAGALFALVTFGLGEHIVALIADSEAVRAAARPYLPMVALIPLAGMPAWLLDGVFLGATRGAALRNAAILATIAYVALDIALRPWGAAGLWWAMLSSYMLRALFLGLHWPGLMRALAKQPLASEARPA